jgi:DNA-directed RNA polymerase specialized sigma24 family protein
MRVMATLNERHLLERLRQRDEVAFNELVRLYSDAVLEHVRARVGDPAVAADVVQEVFAEAFHRAERAPRVYGLFVWLCGIADELGERAPGTMSEE